MRNYGEIMFSAGAKAWQTRAGSRGAYEKMTARPAPSGFSEREIAFIAARDSFYMASVTEDGWPYVQHRGGPIGFLKVLDGETIAFADYGGNKQFVSAANLQSNSRVSLLLMDYPNRARLKLAGHATVVPADDAPVLREAVTEPDDPLPERIFTIRVSAFDWNCPKFITPRYTEAEVSALVRPQIEDLIAENARLKEAVAATLT